MGIKLFDTQEEYCVELKHYTRNSIVVYEGTRDSADWPLQDSLATTLVHFITTITNEAPREHWKDLHIEFVTLLEQWHDGNHGLGLIVYYNPDLTVKDSEHFCLQASCLSLGSSNQVTI